MSVLFTHISHEICTCTRNKQLKKNYQSNIAKTQQINEIESITNRNQSELSTLRFLFNRIPGKTNISFKQTNKKIIRRWTQISTIHYVCNIKPTPNVCMMSRAEHITLTAKPAQIVPYLIVWGCWATLYFYYLVYICKHIMNKKANARNEKSRGEHIEFVNLIEWANLFRRGRSIVMGMHNVMCLLFDAWCITCWINTYCIKKKRKNTIITEMCVF